MKTTKMLPALLLSLFAASAFAQASAPAGSAAAEVRRDVNQQQRIQQGLQSGQLTVQEAAKLEGEQARIDKAEAKALKDGALDEKEKAGLQKMQDKASEHIRAQKHDAQTGDPNSVSSQRMQADVQRNINQDKRIAAGIKEGSLTNKEVSKLEAGQAKVHRAEAKAGSDGQVGAGEQKRVQQRENRQSKRIRAQKHDHQNAGQTAG
ncbi:MAG TPA: hypothetical protein VEC06_02085 [Paucimonas sp.]|nr:hypothetical protein [Paucimonas sp.]